MANSGNYKSVLKHFYNAPTDIQKYFDELPSLIENYPWEVSISYLFSFIEYIQRLALYCTIVKLHRANPEMTWDAINKQKFSRQEYREFFARIMGKPLPKSIAKKIEEAEDIRDHVIHGKSTSDAKMRKAVVGVIDYASEFNEFVYERAALRPFGSLKGFKGRGISLDKSTTRWILKGMGFSNVS